MVHTKHLKCRVLVDIPATPWDGIGIQLMQCDADFASQHGDAAVAAMMTVTPQHRLPRNGIGYAYRRVFRRCGGRCAQHGAKLQMRIVRAGDRFEPLPEDRQVRIDEELRRAIAIAGEMGVNCSVETARCLRDFRDRLAQAAAIDGWLDDGIFHEGLRGRWTLAQRCILADPRRQSSIDIARSLEGIVPP
ncbi:MAG: hypothetical protein ABI870_15165 [Rhodanobacter sp.]